jgi:hypothetical protein
MEPFMPSRLLLAVWLLVGILVVSGCARSRPQWLALAFASDENIADAGMLVETRQGDIVTTTTVLETGLLYRNADELRSLRSTHVKEASLIWEDSPTYIRGGTSLFRAPMEGTITGGAPSGLKLESTAQVASPAPAGVVSSKGWKLFRIAGGESSSVFLAVPLVNRAVRSDRLLSKAVLCRGWDEVRRTFPGDQPPFDSVVVTVKGSNDHDVAPDFLEAFELSEVPEWLR